MTKKFKMYDLMRIVVYRGIKVVIIVYKSEKTCEKQKKMQPIRPKFQNTTNFLIVYRFIVFTVNREKIMRRTLLLHKNNI